MMFAMCPYILRGVSFFWFFPFSFLWKEGGGSVLSVDGLREYFGCLEFALSFGIVVCLVVWLVGRLVGLL